MTKRRTFRDNCPVSLAQPCKTGWETKGCPICGRPPMTLAADQIEAGFEAMFDEAP